MFDAFASVALETLRDVLIGEAKFLSSVEVEEVQWQLKTMHCFLRDADRREGKYNTETVRNWLWELRELAYKAEDVLERYAVQVTSKRERTGLKKVLDTFTSIHYEFSARKEIENIMSRMANLTQSLESKTKEESSSSNSIEIDDGQRLRRTYGHDVIQEHFVGMENDIQLLKSLVASDDRSNRVISICGMGGLGKTTLATKIYNGEVVQRYFEARAWVCISQQFQPKVVFQGILKQLVPNQAMEDDEDKLVRELYKVQKEKRCLVVLDDIWKAEDWIMLSCAFPITEATGCKVLLTSRYENIASSSMGRVHKLGCLSEDEGWELLKRIALLIDHSQELITTESKMLEDEGKEIVRKCGCLPLAISVIGGILRGKKTSSEWEKVKKNIDLYLKQGEGVGKDTRILQILDLSYNVVPYNLKPCFLYLGCFQEDKDIEAEQLYLLWMAEGMISSENKGRGETLRDVAERYLYELANRCMVQVKVEDDEYSIYDRFVSCRLHDLMRDLCLSKGKQEEFVEVVDTHRPTDIGSSLGRTHRLAVHNKEKLEDLQFLYKRRNQNLRSLLLLHFQYTGILTISCIDFGMFTSLKILMLECCEFKNDKLPDGIEKLILLKHLSLYESKVDEVPPSIKKLPCLQSLDVRTNCQLKLPSVINSTGRLRHLFLPAEITCIEGGGKLKLDGLNELETLSWFNSQSVDFRHIHKLVNLRELNGYICDEESLSAIVHHISDHQYQLRKTIFGISSSCAMNSEQGGSIDLLWKMLMCDSLVKLCMSCHVRKLPGYEPQLCRNLIYLTLNDCRMEEDPMETLEKFPMLRTLQLVKNAFVGREMVCRAAGFPQLRHLYIIGLRTLVEWRVEESAMPNLSTLKLNDLRNLVEWRVEERAMPNLLSLHIGRCKELKMIPEGLRFITTLQKMTIRWMSQKFVDRIRIVDGEDYDKIKHIPSINYV